MTPIYHKDIDLHQVLASILTFLVFVVGDFPKGEHNPL